MTAPEIDITAEATAPDDGPSPEERIVADLVARIDRLQEDADRLGMYRHLSYEWQTAHLNAVTKLAQARTERADLKRRWGI